MYRKYIVLSLLAVLMLFAVSCVPGDGHNTPVNPAGFFWGIWHGWIAPVSLILSLFNPDITIYEIHNTGWWYDFGFYIAIIGGFGSLSLFRSKKSGND
jgi:hypothetical protein